MRAIGTRGRSRFCHLCLCCVVAVCGLLGRAKIIRRPGHPYVKHNMSTNESTKIKFAFERIVIQLCRWSEQKCYRWGIYVYYLHLYFFSKNYRNAYVCGCSEYFY